MEDRTPGQFAARLEQRLRKGKRLEPDHAAPTQSAELDRLWSRAEEQAALSGRFNPNDIVPHGDTQTRVKVMSRLAASSIVEVAGESTQWLLGRSVRSDVLKRLVATSRLAQALADPLPPTDLFGEKLRDLLRSPQAATPERSSLDELLASAAAVEATEGLSIAKPDAAQIRREIARREFLADYEVLLKDGFVGREEQLHELGQLLSAPVSSLSRPWEGLVLTGLGGAGKSTLLAKFATDVVQRNLATVVVIDFDRPGMDPNDQPWLELEMARQVSAQHEALAPRLSELRSRARQQKVRTEGFAKQSSNRRIESDRSLRSIVYELSRALQEQGLGDKPLLLILDTFEEVAQRELSGRVIDWLAELGEGFYPVQLRVIVSGRLFDRDLETLKGFGVLHVMEIKELDVSLAAQLLLNQSVPAPLAMRLSAADFLPRRPLELKLVAKLMTAPSAPSFDELERDVRKGGEAAKTLFAGLVYRRVLLRIKDPLTRTLAYPGLVLRYVTPELIQKVLAPALELSPMSVGEAKEALNDLAAYSWLCYRQGADEVWHRKDLRRSLLQVMIGENPARAKGIHRAAISYFTGSGRTFKEREEAMYHRLMLLESPDHPESFERVEVRKAAEALGADVADLPASAAALVRLASDKELSSADVSVLPREHMWDGYVRTGARLVAAREFQKATELMAAVPPDVLNQYPLMAFEWEAPFAAAKWQVVTAYGVSSRFNRLRPRDQEANDAEFFVTAVVGTDVEYVPPNGREVTAQDSASSAERMAMAWILRCASSRSGTGLPRQAEAFGAANTWPGMPESLRKRLRILDAVVHPERASDMYLPISPRTVVVSEAVLADISRAAYGVSEPAREIINEVIAQIRSARTQSRSRWTVRSLLAGIDSSRINRDGQYPDIPIQAFAPSIAALMLRSPLPELRDPCRYALLTAFANASDAGALGALFAELIGLPLIDLDPDVFATAVQLDPERALEPYVEAVDRLGALGNLLARASAMRPNVAPLAAVTAAHRRWTDVIGNLLQLAPE